MATQSTMVELERQIKMAASDVAELEAIYRRCFTVGDTDVFADVIRRYAANHPDDVLFAAWAYRLDVQAHSPEDSSGFVLARSQTRRWLIAVAISGLLGVISGFFSRGKPPIPVPGASDPLFWIGYFPLVALGLLIYLVLGDCMGRRLFRYGSATVLVLIVVSYVAARMSDRTDDMAMLCALHLPIIYATVLGVVLIVGRSNPLGQCYALLLKSVEVILTAVIFLAAGGTFLGLTVGTFSVLGISVPEEVFFAVAAGGFGAIPVLAVASVYDPERSPLGQDWVGTGVAQILRIVARLLLPLVFLFLVVYVGGFIPVYFWRPFEDREVLFVYNIAILAILVLVTVVVSGVVESQVSRQATLLRYTVLALGGLTILLNIYALAAIAYRMLEFGLTPNRYAVVGWNIVTLVMLAWVGGQLVRRRFDPWIQACRESISRAAVLAPIWAAWVLVGLPLSFR